MQNLHLVRNVSVSEELATNLVPFPVLRILKLDTPYPFNDDVLFRGNSATLKTLRLQLNSSAVNKLNQSRVFRNKDMVLQNVTIAAAESDWFDHVDSEVNIEKLMSNLVGSAERLSVRGYKVERACLSAMKQGQGFQNVKVIELHMPLSVFDVLGLFKALPSLVEHNCSLASLGPELEHIAADELPDHIFSTYSDVGKNIQIWHPTFFSHLKASETADYIMMLALVCPKLYQLEIPPISFQGYLARVAKALDSGPYSKYARQLIWRLNVVRK
ncbi:hypothetical protein GGF41_007066 [Coemansia sp. RSA 2531]|nr:hypothetical protein GGF41_007066 [Coemansia sp. RSA 2531]